MPRPVAALSQVSRISTILLFWVGCVEAKHYEPPEEPPPPPVPPAPTLRVPTNNSYVGAMKTGLLRPTFRWEPSLWSGPEEVGYELELSTDPAFAFAVKSVKTTSTSYQPSNDLDVSQVPPVGARYYWRVRACIANVCSEPSPTWKVNVGRVRRDINGDGYADVFVTASGGGGTLPAASGRLYLFLGAAGTTFDAGRDSVLIGSGNTWFRIAADVGDINADGFSDLAARVTDQSGRSPRVQIYLGAAGDVLDAGVDHSFDAVDGRALGDVNGDGFDDLFVVPSSGTPGIAYGSAGPLAISPFPAAAQLREAGDVNGDGYGDAMFYDFLASQVRIFFGGSGMMDGDADGVLNGQSADLFGSAMSAAGDLNGDGFADILIGTPGDDAKGENTGRAYAYLGGPGAFNTSPDGIYDGDPLYANLGMNVDAAGDINGDGYDDVALRFTTTNLAGGVRIYFGNGGSQLNTSHVTELLGESGNFFGKYVAAGDVNGDGFDDLMVGAPHFATETTAAEGRAYVYLGGAAPSLDDDSDGLLMGEPGDFLYFGTLAIGDLLVRLL